MVVWLDEKGMQGKRIQQEIRSASTAKETPRPPRAFMISR